MLDGCGELQEGTRVGGEKKKEKLLLKKIPTIKILEDHTIANKETR
jgi:hypothetical protein